MAIKKFVNHSSRSQGYILVLLSTIGFASFGVWAKLVGDTYEVFTQAWTRALIVSITLLVVGVITKQLRHIDRKDLKWFAMYVTLTLFTVAPIYYALINMDLGTAIILFYSAYMITSYLVGKFYLGEKITAIKIIAIVLSIIGMSLTLGVEIASVSVLALILAIVNGIASGGEVSFTKRMSSNYSSLQLTLVSWMAIGITHFIIAVFLGENLLPTQTVQSSIGIVLYSLTAMLAFWLVVAGYKKIEAGIGGLIGTLEVPLAVILGAIIFGEQLAFQAIIGGLLIFLAAGLPDGLEVIRNRRRRHAN